ncbi:MAG: topoisomerase II [Micrococcales bacterium]|nr:MAG: topoisomerase II [Micrococcales bacterium]PIE26040.1 MAG: topoisomerase II [Micrococcales bacterium]
MTTTPTDIPVVAGRKPCPCGSGKRYKQCHGRAARRAAVPFVARPFEGLPAEGDWVAMREIVPAATATARTTEGTDVVVCTVLPLGMAALRRQDGTVLLALQVSSSSGDPGRDAAAALRAALENEPGSPVRSRPAGPSGPRLQDLLDMDCPFEVTVHDSYGFWVSAGAAAEEDIDAEALSQANDAMIPTRRLTQVSAAYWCSMGGRRYLRWAVDSPENTVLDAIARLYSRGQAGLGTGTKYLGSFRASGILIPVWELPADAEAEQLEAPAAGFLARMNAAMDVTGPLTADERRARAGVVSRQLTLR